MNEHKIMETTQGGFVLPNTVLVKARYITQENVNEIPWE